MIKSSKTFLTNSHTVLQLEDPKIYINSDFLEFYKLNYNKI